MPYRASRLAIASARKSGDVALDYINRFRKTGETTFSNASGERLQITVLDDFVCLHLESECVNELVCPKGSCPKLRSAPRAATPAVAGAEPCACGSDALVSID